VDTCDLAAAAAAAAVAAAAAAAAAYYKFNQLTLDYKNVM
jgi:hypothetical protein